MQCSTEYWNNSVINHEIEAHLAQYYYETRQPGYEGSDAEAKWNSLEYKHIKALEKYITQRGTIAYGTDPDILQMRLLNEARGSLLKIGYEGKFNHDLPATSAFNNFYNVGGCL